MASGRHVIVIGADQRVLARVPIEAAFGDTNQLLDVISAALPLTAPGQQGGVTDVTLPNGSSALAVAHLVKAPPGQVIILQEKVYSPLRAHAALSVNLFATTRVCLLVPRLAFHRPPTRPPR